MWPVKAHTSQEAPDLAYSLLNKLRRVAREVGAVHYILNIYKIINILNYNFKYILNLSLYINMKFYILIIGIYKKSKKIFTNLKKFCILISMGDVYTGL